MKRIMITVALAAVLLLAACGSSTIEIELMNGETVMVDTDGLSKEQVQVLEDVADGQGDMMNLMQGGVFTREELTELGLDAGTTGGMNGAGVRPDVDLSDVDIDDIDLDGLSEEQIAAVEAILAGERTVQEIIDDGVLTMQQLRDIGMGGGRPDGKPRD